MAFRPPKTIKFREFKRLLRRHGIRLKAGARHLFFESPDGTKYPVPYRKESDDVERSYVNAARRAFHLTREDGVSHQEFYRKR